MKTTEDLKNAKASAGKGFGSASSNQQASVAPETVENGGLTAANGLGNVIIQQGSELGIVAQNLDQQLDQLAEPVADYFAEVISGKALVTKVLQKMHEKAQPQNLNMQVAKIEPPAVPTVPSINAADFFAQPKPISLPGK